MPNLPRTRGFAAYLRLVAELDDFSVPRFVQMQEPYDLNPMVCSPDECEVHVRGSVMKTALSLISVLLLVLLSGCAVEDGHGGGYVGVSGGYSAPYYGSTTYSGYSYPYYYPYHSIPTIATPTTSTITAIRTIVTITGIAIITIIEGMVDSWLLRLS